MTSTVNPAPHLVNLKDPRERLLQYLSSILTWIKKGPFDEIVFCDNSNTPFPIGRLESGGRRLEVLSFHGNNPSWVLGKGYGEQLILRHALEHSDLVRKASAVWKVTGRLYVTNCNALKEIHSGNGQVFHGNDTRYFKTSPEFLRTVLLPAYQSIDERGPVGRCIEIVHEDVLKKHFENGTATLMKEKPDLIGQAGGTGEIYGRFDEDIIGEARQWRERFEA